VHWNEDIGEWQLKCVAYTGNNMRKTLLTHSAGHGREVSGQPSGSTTGVYVADTDPYLYSSICAPPVFILSLSVVDSTLTWQKHRFMSFKQK
jgi:hypothetical protein